MVTIDEVEDRSVAWVEDIVEPSGSSEEVLLAVVTGDVKLPVVIAEEGAELLVAEDVLAVVTGTVVKFAVMLTIQKSDTKPSITTPVPIQ